MMADDWSELNKPHEPHPGNGAFTFEWRTGKVECLTCRQEFTDMAAYKAHSCSSKPHSQPPGGAICGDCGAYERTNPWSGRCATHQTDRSPGQERCEQWRKRP